MLRVLLFAVGTVAMLMAGPAAAQSPSSSGTAFFINADGWQSRMRTSLRDARAPAFHPWERQLTGSSTSKTIWPWSKWLLGEESHSFGSAASFHD